jgi:hypothetical protein
MKVFERRELKKIAGTKREEETSNWRKLHVKELHGMYSYQMLSNIVPYNVATKCTYNL